MRCLTNQRLFGGLRDFGPPPNLQFGRLLPMGRLRDWLVGYIGCTGELGFSEISEYRLPSARRRTDFPPCGSPAAGGGCSGRSPFSPSSRKCWPK